jgi:hypothetical protein
VKKSLLFEMMHFLGKNANLYVLEQGDEKRRCSV